MEVGKSWAAGQAEEGRVTPQASQVAQPEEVAGESARARLTPVSCEGCGTVFTPSRPLQRCCSGRCRAAMSRRRGEEQRIELLERLWPDDPGRPE